MSRSVRILTTIAIILAVAVVVVRNLPRTGYLADLGRIGQGQPAVVLVFEAFAGPVVDAMALFDRVRGDYADRLVFLVADTGTPDGREFVARHRAQVGQVLTFRGDGSLVQLEFLVDETALRERLRQDLGL
jgi:hypothetical protein